MSIYRINFIGCGRLGKTLAALIRKNKAGTISGIVNASEDSSRASVHCIGEGAACPTIAALPPADLYFITTPDDLIEKICAQLITDHPSSHGKTIVHCSGALSSDILAKARQYHCTVAAIHPIKSFADVAASIKTFAGTYCSLEGDDVLLNDLTALFEKIGAIVFRINKDQKKICHAASVLANNYLVTLHYHALQCYKAAGIDDETAKGLVSWLMTETLHHLQTADHHKILTGPIQRGDRNTIANHLLALEQYPFIKTIYAALGQATLPLTQHLPLKIAELQETLRENIESI